MALYLDVGPDDLLRIGDTFLAVERKSGSRARLRIIGKQEVELLRNKKHAAPPPPNQYNPVSQDTGD